LDTLISASRGHSVNQSIVQQLTSDGNIRQRVRKALPTGLIASTICRLFLDKIGMKQKTVTIKINSLHMRAVVTIADVFHPQEVSLKNNYNYVFPSTFNAIIIVYLATDFRDHK
jgi:hypothetical protein